MERARWTDERLDSEMEKIDRNFDRVFAELRVQREEIRAEIAALRIELKEEISGVRGEIGGQITGVRGELTAIRADLAATQRKLTFIAILFALGLLALMGAEVLGAA